ncbi:MAG: hypothetical protein LBT88_04540 [Oscillospiraceae bacterium]|jgi:uncharacterized pyridoxamine 5'-phosphate oxidase family protein|nr:hypothetical protein [Oscillospiraceae bacterium]
MDKVYDFLADAGTFYYATAEENGQPRVRPFGFCMKYNGKLYFGMGRPGGVTKPSTLQTIANPKFEICATNSKMEWIRLAGTAVLDESQEAYEAAMAASPSLKAMYPEAKLYAGFYIKDATATISSFAGAPEVIKF